MKPVMKILSRNNVHSIGKGTRTLMLAHGFGCDQKMWRFLTPAFEADYRIILFDLVGSGGSDLAAYDHDKYSSLHGHAADVIEIIEQVGQSEIVFIGHSVSAMIGMLAAIRKPALFAGQVMISPSPCYFNDGDYVGGFNFEDVKAMLQLMQDNLLAWSTQMAPLIMGAPGRPDLQQELTERFCRNDPDIMRHFGRVAFLADHRCDVPLSKTPTLIIQSSDDLIAPFEVGQHLHRHMHNSTFKVVDNVGHCPHMSAPGPSGQHIKDFLARMARPGRR